MRQSIEKIDPGQISGASLKFLSQPYRPANPARPLVYIKQIDLTNFKSFGGTTHVPLTPEFTVVSGPNGSGKSNILDALLFCLGISSSKGMRADRLPDLVNQNQAQRKGTSEASVTVTFDLDSEFPLAPDGTPANVVDAAAIAEIGQGDPEWSVTRRLRVTKSGYTSSYYINGEAATLGELHEKLSQLRIYPEGYNVVLQGDVTSIISMNLRERREIIDELAGVAAFDRKIEQAKRKFEAVQEREEQCHIIERELIAQRDKLADDRIKAEKYKALKAELLEKQTWEKVLQWRQIQAQTVRLREQIESGDRERLELMEQLAKLGDEIAQKSEELERLNAEVKALGEDEALAQQTQLARQEADRDRVQQRCDELETAIERAGNRVTEIEAEIERDRLQIAELTTRQTALDGEVERLRTVRNEAAAKLEADRETASEMAATADAWMREQMELRHQTEELQNRIAPQQAERAQLQERLSQADRQLAELTESRDRLTVELATARRQQATIVRDRDAAQQSQQQLEAAATEAETELQVQQQTRTRLENEQRDKQRRLDKLEARAQAMQAASGSQATQLLVKSGIEGICGLVAQLGRVENEFRMALETAAGGRLGQLVVEDDLVAATGIRLLKERRAGRATFLPLNKIRSPRINLNPEVKRAPGFIDLALDLIDCEPRYDDVFAYVFGSTVVFDNLANARTALGRARIVTLDGELLEASGAMTGGASRHRSQLRFGDAAAGEPKELRELRERLEQISTVLDRGEVKIAEWALRVKETARSLQEASQTARDLGRDLERADRDIEALQTQLERATAQLERATTDRQTAETRLGEIDRALPELIEQLQTLQTQLDELEASQSQSEWTTLQATIRQQEADLQARDAELQQAQQRRKDARDAEERLREGIDRATAQIAELQQAQADDRIKLTNNRDRLAGFAKLIEQIRAAIATLDSKLLAQKQARDRAETELRDRQTTQQQTDWRLQKSIENQEGRRSQLETLSRDLEERQADLPDPLPELPPAVRDPNQIEALQKSIRNLSRRIEAMEPVNMLALEEFDKTQARLDSLTEKLETLEAERTEVLLRIENFTTLRVRAFTETFDAVNENFSRIFAELSQGDGYLQLTNSENPFESGLNLVAHPKGKPVQRLASMSGGEKSLTALSFIFALQRYRPSPFYAFDEVDMFLDGANVERLAKTIRRQAEQAQFLVVSLRRPTIEASMRTIGVTQARGAYTQVLGLKLPKSAS